MPLLKLVTPQLAQVITKISHKHLEFTPEECQCLQDVIDCVLYGMYLSEFHTKWVSDGKKALTVLFVLNFARGDMVRVKEACVESVTQSIDRGVETEIGDLFHHLVKYQIRLQHSSHHDPQLNSTTNPIGQLLEYCFGRISQKGIDPMRCFSHNDLNEEVMKILSTTIPRTALDIHEEPNVTPKHPLAHLFTDVDSCDVELRVGEDCVTCHKTILSTNSPHFNAQFSHHDPSHHHVKNEPPPPPQYGPEMIHLIHFCYGILHSIPLHHQMPLIALARMHQMQDLVEHVVTKRLVITLQSFMPLVTTMMDDVEMEQCYGQVVVDRLVQFAVRNRREIITERNYDEIPSGLMKRIVLEMVGGEEQVSKGHVTP